MSEDALTALAREAGISIDWRDAFDKPQRVAPDLLNAQGQDWGLTTFSARGLRASGFAGFRAMLRAAFAHAGGARIDHILGLKRLWLVPHGGGANDGAYVDYPFEDLRRLIALESHRHRAIAIGEDLGTIPEGFGDTLAADGILGIRVLWFERHWPRTFLMPWQWSDQAMATTTTHDLPTAAGWWRGQDIRHRERLGLSEDPVKEYAERRADAVALWETMDRAEIAAGAPPEDWDGHPFARACAATIAATPAPLALLPLEDVLGLVEQPNLPGPTDDGHPNWRRRLPADAAGIVATPIAQATLDALTQGRGRRSAS
uniref:4-alpha-glucanotransferase n=1 Tax=Coralloluteibacterium stylophorae TaxID=1776034 RepID=A0A8J7VQ61_9GAMM